MKDIRTAILCTIALGLAIFCIPSCSKGGGDTLSINDLGYFEERGVNVLVYSNLFTGGFNDEKNSGIELIHHGVRTAQGGAVRLSNTPEQWDLVPETVGRVVDTVGNSIEVELRYEDFDFDSRIVVTGKGSGVEIAVYLDEPVPDELEGDAGFNLEFLPSQYWSKTFLCDGRTGRFPRYAASNTIARPNSEKVKQFKGYRTYDDRGTGQFVDVVPLETGHEFVLATDAPERMVRVSSDDIIGLYDGRMLAQNGWFVLRSILPAGKTGKVLSWVVTPNSVKDWVREPNIGFCQAGYLPQQPKESVIELDKNDRVLSKASIFRIDGAGRESKVFTGPVKLWGDWYKYRYAKFDFSSVTEPGVYYIQYGDTRTNDFIISEDVYDDITVATSDVWIPIHLNHMTVNEGYRIWHGEPFKEGYLQAPENTDHFDLHAQGPTTDTRYKALQLIPGLNVGGFFDAGDFDIETHSNISVVQNLVSIWNNFRPDRDETFVDEDQRYVDLHRPDGTPDILQYIEHGTLNIVAQAENIGHMSSTLSNSVLDNYHHLGDASTITDGLHYDPSLKPYQKSADGKSSGTPDDMWAFTSRNASLDMNAADMLAAAYGALKGYDDDLAQRALNESKRLDREATEIMASDSRRNPRFVGNAATSLQLYKATGDKAYLDKFDSQIWAQLDRAPQNAITTALEAIPCKDEAYREKLVPYVEKFRDYVESFEEDNPYGVPVGTGNWAGSGAVVTFGTAICQASRNFPEIVDSDLVFKAVNYLFGCHPYHNYSLVAAVGAARPKAVFYGNNRADFSFIPGNVAPGLLFRKPDHFENYDDWPFLWGQNEGTISGNTSYLIFGLSFLDLIGR